MAPSQSAVCVTGCNWPGANFLQNGLGGLTPESD